MVEMEIGRVVMKIAGREGGKYATVVKKVDDNFVLVSGPKLLTGVKRRKANILHLEPTSFKVDVKENATDEEIIEAFKKSGLMNTLNLKLPSAAEMKEEKKVRESKPAKEEKAKAKEAKPKKKAKE